MLIEIITSVAICEILGPVIPLQIWPTNGPDDLYTMQNKNLKFAAKSACSNFSHKLCPACPTWIFRYARACWRNWAGQFGCNFGFLFCMVYRSSGPLVGKMWTIFFGLTGPSEIYAKNRYTFWQNFNIYKSVCGHCLGVPDPFKSMDFTIKFIDF